jgi:hypothetical protein
MSYGASIDRIELRNFQSSWPCHGIDRRIARVWCQWDDNGDLINLEVFYGNGRMVRDSALYDGPAMLALVNDKQREMHPEHSR